MMADLVHKLKSDMGHVVKCGWIDIGRYLYLIHSNYLKDNCVDLSYMERILLLNAGSEPVREDEITSEGSLESLEWELGSMRSGSSTEVDPEPEPCLEEQGDVHSA